MQTFSLKSGLVMMFNDRLLIFKRLTLNKLLHFVDELGETILLTQKEYNLAYLERTLWVVPDQPELGYLPTVRNAPRDLTTYRSAHSDEARRRKAYVDAFLDCGKGISVKEQKDLIQSVHLASKDPKTAPSRKTVRRWLSRYKWKSLTALVPQHEAKGRKTVISGDVEEILLDVLDERYLVRTPAPLSQVIAEFTMRLTERNQQRSRLQQIKIPSRMSVYRYVDNLDPVAVDERRMGVHAARQKHRNATGLLKVLGICHRWEIDHTTLDVMLIDPETGKTIGRPYLTVVIDRFSRMVMGYVLHHAAPNTESVLRAIERAICPNDKLLAMHPKVLNTWPARGLPRQIVPDNAAEFHSGNLTAAFDELGIEILYPRSRGPQMKGAVERFFGTLARDFVHTLPGTTFANIQQRGDYDSEGHACLTYSQWDALFVRWLVDIYHQTPHRGLRGLTPQAAWMRSEASRVIQMPVDLDALESILAARKAPNLHHYGVEVGGHIYHSSDLAAMRMERGGTVKVDVRYRDDLGHIWVYDDRRNYFLQVPAKDERLKGLSRDLYDAARKLLRADGQLQPNTDQIINAYRDIQQGVEGARNSKRLSDRRRQAALSRNRGGEEISLAIVEQRPRVISDDLMVSIDGLSELRVSGQVEKGQVFGGTNNEDD